MSNNMDTQSTITSEHKYTSSIDDVREVINSETIYCLVPRSCIYSYAT